MIVLFAFYKCWVCLSIGCFSLSFFCYAELLNANLAPKKKTKKQDILDNLMETEADK